MRWVMDIKCVWALILTLQTPNTDAHMVSHLSTDCFFLFLLLLFFVNQNLIWFWPIGCFVHFNSAQGLALVVTFNQSSVCQSEHLVVKLQLCDSVKVSFVICKHDKRRQGHTHWGQREQKQPELRSSAATLTETVYLGHNVLSQNV